MKGFFAQTLLAITIGFAKRKTAFFKVLLFAALLTVPAISRAEIHGGGGAGGTSSGDTGGACNHKPAFDKNQIEQMTWEVVGSEAPCYMKLFEMESSWNPSCEARPPKMPNPPGIGLCMIEGQRNLRSASRAGTACDVEDHMLDGSKPEGVKQQIKCCRDLMIKTSSTYFSTVRYCSKGWAKND